MLSKKLILIITSVVIVAGLSTGAFMCIYSQTKEFDEVYRDDIYIEETHIGGLTREVAKAQVSAAVQAKREAKSITLHGDDQEWVIPYARFKAEYNVDQVLEDAFHIGHEGNVFKRFREFTKKDFPKKEYKLERSYNKEIANEIVKEYADDLYIAPQDAKMVRKDRSFIITPEQPGRELDVKATADKVTAVYESSEESKVEAVIATVEAKRTSSFYEDVQTPIASFYTTFSNRDPERNTNLKVGAATINTSVEPGETFALSNYFGNISAEQGYKNSKVIVNGNLVEGIGGGICQVASTLYNSVLLTDLKVTSRQNHSLPVGYIPLGRDATYASGAIDFKFENPTQYPAYVESYLENNRLYVNIFGHQSLKPETDIKFESVITEVVPAPAPKYEKDPNLAKGKEEQQVKPLDGKKVDLYRFTYKDGKLINKVLENRSYYRPRAALIRVGTKEASVVVPPPVVLPVVPEVVPEVVPPVVPPVVPKETPQEKPKDVPKDVPKELPKETPQTEEKPEAVIEQNSTSFFEPL